MFEVGHGLVRFAKVWRGALLPFAGKIGHSLRRRGVFLTLGGSTAGRHAELFLEMPHDSLGGFPALAGWMYQNSLLRGLEFPLFFDKNHIKTR